MSFHQELLTRARPIWDRMLPHPFLKETAEGRVAKTVFGNWMQQDYLFVRGAIGFIGALVSRAPLPAVSGLAGAIPALQSELELFERMAARHGISFQGIKFTPTCHAYVQFMLATAHTASFEEGFTLLYGAEKAYLDSWTWVRENLKGASPWREFIDRWSDESFRQWVRWIEETLDDLAGQASPALREKMIELILLTGQYELLFWDLALGGQSWPE